MSLPQLNEDEQVLLYTRNPMRKSFQWELWQCCNNFCTFCVLGKSSKYTAKERQLKSLADLKHALKNLDFEKYNNVSLIGGEFFQGQLDDPKVHDSFFEIIEMLASLYKDKKIGAIWCTATLTIGDQADLYTMLDIFDNAGLRPHPDYSSSGLWICTSWDKQGRFHTPENLENWQSHTAKIKKEYPWVKLNTSVILTQKICEMYLDGEFVPKEFMKEHKTDLVLSPPRIFDMENEGFESQSMFKSMGETGQLDKHITKMKADLEKNLGFRFFPDRRTFRRFILKFSKQDADLYSSLFDVARTTDELYKNFNDNEGQELHERNEKSNIEACAIIDTTPNTNCSIEPFEAKHPFAYAGYIDSNDCMLCDRDQIWKGAHSELSKKPKFSKLDKIFANE